MWTLISMMMDEQEFWNMFNKNMGLIMAQIITFGSMAAKSAIRDVARVLELPLDQSDKIS